MLTTQSPQLLSFLLTARSEQGAEESQPSAEAHFLQTTLVPHLKQLILPGQAGNQICCVSHIRKDGSNKINKWKDWSPSSGQNQQMKRLITHFRWPRKPTYSLLHWWEPGQAGSPLVPWRAFAPPLLGSTGDLSSECLSSLRLPHRGEQGFHPAPGATDCLNLLLTHRL